MNVRMKDPELAYLAATAPKGKSPPAPPPMPVKLVAPPSLRLGDVEIGAADTGGPIGIDPVKLLDGRLLIQGTSGAGKSWTLRRLIEQTTAMIQQIIIDPEGEFRGIAEAFGHTYIDASKLDTAALAIVARRAREHRLSLVVDISDVDRESQMKAFASILAALIEAPKEHWHPCLVLVDEAHLFAPFGGQAGESPSVRKASISALIDLMSRGRKRGLVGILATQRLARLSKSVISEALNCLIGLNVLDLDIRRAAETIGWDASKAFDRLPMLQSGDFVAVGPAFSRSPAVLRVGAIQTKHTGAAPQISAPGTVTPADAAQLLDLDRLEKSTAADAAVLEEGSLLPSTRAIRGFIRDPAFAVAGGVWGALLELVPNGALLSDLAKHLRVKPEKIAAALELLDGFGTVEFTGEGNARAVRIAKGMEP